MRPFNRLVQSSRPVRAMQCALPWAALQWRPVYRRPFASKSAVENKESAPCYLKAAVTAAPRRRKTTSRVVKPVLATTAASDVTAAEKSIPFEEQVFRVDSREKAEGVLAVLRAHPDRVWACDTEVADIDVKTQGPVGNGTVTCISIYGGPGLDFGEGVHKNVLWIDNIDDNENLIGVFSDWFGDEQYKKVWHNYGFDRHVMYNERIDCRGFGGDTMHMARLWDTGRSKITGAGTGYSLAALSSELVAETVAEPTNSNPGEETDSADKKAKISMMSLFGVPRKLSSGADSKIVELPPIRDLQTDPSTRDKWIVYSAKDAYATWHLYNVLKAKLEAINWCPSERYAGTMFDFYQLYWVPFGEILTDMERNGIRVDLSKLQASQVKAQADRNRMETIFMDWAAKQCPGGKYINPSSKTQIGQLLFGKYVKGDAAVREREVVFELDKTGEQFAEDVEDVQRQNPFAALTALELKEECKKYGLKASGKKRAELVSMLLALPEIRYAGYSESDIIDICNTRNISIAGGNGPLSRDELIARLDADEDFAREQILQESEKAELKMPKKKFKFAIKTIGYRPIEFTPSGAAQVNFAVLRTLSGNNVFGDEKEAEWGGLYQFYGGGAAGAEACRAVGALAQMSQIDTIVQTFLLPLQKLADAQSRIHCSLNLNTETGRLSSRMPNLQNQPALEKDQYKIRDAFCAEDGNTLIVADYGQLELRLLAHMTDCKSMIDAFLKGGCFHSRTAMGMYSYIRDAVNDGSVQLEWDYSKGAPTVPLVKDKYGSERRKAKTLNFSIAYGKTAFGLSKDWNTTPEQAEETLRAWYSDRPEVEMWQKNTQAGARRNKYVRTLMGRLRNLPDASTRGAKGSGSMRAAINTPIQGGAADVVVLAMIKISRSEVLRKLGYKLLLQIHDEVILEGPKEHSAAALEELTRCMENPFDDIGLKNLKVHLDVDGKTADTWYQAK